MTTPDVTEIPALLDQIDSEIASVTADGAYDGEAVYDAVAARHPAAAVVIPPRATAVSNEATVTQRDRHIAGITTHGRMGEAAQGSARVSAWNGSGGWQRRSGYNRRSLVETGMVSLQDHRRLALNARTLPNQRTEAKIGCSVINRMTGLGMPATVRVR